MATYEQWVESLGLPIYKGYYIEDLRTVETGWWEERGCNAAFIQLVGLAGVAEARVIEVPPGKTTLPYNFALDEIFYVLEGTGLTTIWGAGQSTRKTFEWHDRSLFLIPRQSFHQLTNAQGDKPAKLLGYNYLPFVMQAIEDPEFFFNNAYLPSQGVGLENFYSEAKKQWSSEGKRGGYRWYGNFFPDMGAWDKLDPQKWRGAGGNHMEFRFPNSPYFGHMAVFPTQTYKLAHRHGPGRSIVIPAGEGYSLMWEEGKEKIFCPWHEASLFTPPNQWYHQHFNVGKVPARYLALSPARIMALHLPNGQIEYPDEDPWIRQTFEKELAKKGLTSLMPEEAYKDRNYQWEYAEDKE